MPELRFPEFEGAGEWRNAALNKISEIVMGSSPKSSAYNEDCVGLPLLQGNADIKNRLSAPRIFTSQITKECEIGDILLSVRAPVGTVAKSNHNACIGRGLSAIRSSCDNSQEFVYQWLLYFEPHWNSVSQGGTFDAVNSDDIRKLKIPIPKNTKEQQKIADCLSSLDKLIATHTQKHQTLQSYKKGLMQNLFPAEGKTVPALRFPEFEDAGDWEEKAIGKIGDVVTGNTPSTTNRDYYVGNIMFVSPADISENRFVSETLKTLSSKGLAVARKIPAYSILFVCIGSTIGKVAQNAYKCATNQQINAVIPFDENENSFVYYSLAFHAHEIAELAGNQAVPIINKSLFSSSFLIVPPEKDEQKMIADCLSSIDNLITAQAQKIEALKVHKKGLMQQLFPVMDKVSV